MCLVAIARDAHPRWPLILLANRDEFHDRPSAAASWWTDAPDVFGGRDLQSGGSWLAVARSGRFAVVTNLPARAVGRQTGLSRGELVAGFVTGAAPAGEFLAALAPRAADYAGFCLIAGDHHAALALESPGAGPVRALGQGVFAFSNAPMSARWPKVEQLRARLASLLGSGGEPATATLLEMIGPQANGCLPKPAGSQATGPSVPVPVDELPHTPFVIGARYGTRCSTVVRIGAAGGCEVVERRWAPGGRQAGETRTLFRLDAGFA
ncbi:MAG: NRDE family protein [Chromatiales bacterium]|nr:NRDE family protein [Chromatiales bacterium]